MRKKEDKNTRYFIDVDVKAHSILQWDYDQRGKLVMQKMNDPFHHRLFLTKGQYHKLVEKHATL
jgi:hypothetical protein